MSIKKLLGSDSPFYNMMLRASRCVVDTARIEELKRQVTEQIELFLPCTVFIYDYKSQCYHYISKNIEHLTGYTAEQYMLQGKTLHLSRLHSDDLNLYTGKAVKMMCRKILQRPGKDDYYFWINYRYCHANGRYVTLLQKHRVMHSENGVPLLVVGVLLDITHLKWKKMIFRVASYGPGKRHAGEDTVLHFSSGRKGLLTVREQEVLQLALKGKSEKEIRDKLNIAIGTVKRHKQNIFSKTGARNIREAGEKAGY
jgi:DNA-binding CsgD family transcriptional regulator